MSILERSALDVARDVKSGALGAEEVTRAALDAISSKNGELGAFLSVQADAALETARKVDARRARGEKLGRLAGVPVGIKDAILVKGAPTTAGSKILIPRGEGPADPSRGWVAPYEATAVARLRAEDAIFVGKTNLDEFAMGSSNENSAFFPARNPHDSSRTAASWGSSRRTAGSRATGSSRMRRASIR